jgi:hypothetical protein
VADEDARFPGPERPRRFHELQLPHHQHGAADDPGGVGVVATDSAMTTLTTEAPSTALTVMASRMAGKAISASMRRMTGLSSARK